MKNPHILNTKHNKNPIKVGIIEEQLYDYKQVNFDDFIKKLESDGYILKNIGDKKFEIFDKNGADPNQAKIDFIKKYANSKTDFIEFLYIAARPDILDGEFEKIYQNKINESLLSDPTFQDVYKNWNSMDKFARRNAFEYVNNKIRNLFGKTETELYVWELYDEKDWTARNVGFLKARKSSSESDAYFVNATDIKKWSFGEFLGFIIHENTHFFQYEGKTALSKELADIGFKNYVPDGLSRWWWKNPIEIEAKRYQERISKAIVANLERQLSNSIDRPLGHSAAAEQFKIGNKKLKTKTAVKEYLRNNLQND